jgi:hypothetical protein
MRQLAQQCGWSIHWLWITVGAAIGLVGGLFTASVIGAIVGIPLLLLAWPLFSGSVEPKACA